MAALSGTTAEAKTLDQLYLKNIDASNAQAATVVAGTGASSQTVQGSSTDGALVGNPFTMGVSDGSNFARAVTAGSAVGDANAGTRFGPAAGMRWNGTNYDRERGNIEATALASASRTASLNSADLVCYNGRGLTVVVDVTVVGTGSITVTIQGKDPLSGKYYTLLASAAIVTGVTNTYQVGPGLPATANVSANANIPRTYRISVVHNNANAITYSIGVLESV